MQNHDPRRRHAQERPRDNQSPRFSPDWSQKDAEPRHSDDPYYSRNREYQDDAQAQSSRAAGDSGRGDGETRWRGDQNRTTTPEQRSHGSAPRDVAQSPNEDWAENSGHGLYGSDLAPEQRVYGARAGASDMSEAEVARTGAGAKPRH